VGAQLYEIDTEAEPTVAASTTSSAETAAPAEEQAAPVAAAPAEPQTTSSVAEPGHRVPSINFLGKDGWAVRLSGQAPEAPATKPTSPTGTTLVMMDQPLSPMYGRPAFTDEEMEALVYGGANLEPQGGVVSFDL
jgi:hypothetical protein